MSIRTILIALCALLTACQQPGQNHYDWRDVGQASEVTFGTVISARPVEITGQNTGTGALIGGTAGLGAGSYVGSGSGSLWAALGAAVVGAAVGAAAEQAAADRHGIEYVITEERGKTLTIVQNLNGDETPLRKGQRVMVQTSGSYQRVLPADDLPTKVKRPKRIEVEDRDGK